MNKESIKKFVKEIELFRDLNGQELDLLTSIIEKKEFKKERHYLQKIIHVKICI